MKAIGNGMCEQGRDCEIWNPDEGNHIEKMKMISLGNLQERYEDGILKKTKTLENGYISEICQHMQDIDTYRKMSWWRAISYGTIWFNAMFWLLQ